MCTQHPQILITDSLPSMKFATHVSELVCCGFSTVQSTTFRQKHDTKAKHISFFKRRKKFRKNVFVLEKLFQGLHSIRFLKHCSDRVQWLTRKHYTNTYFKGCFSIVCLCFAVLLYACKMLFLPIFLNNTLITKQGRRGTITRFHPQHKNLPEDLLLHDCTKKTVHGQRR